MGRKEHKKLSKKKKGWIIAISIILVLAIAGSSIWAVLKKRGSGEPTGDMGIQAVTVAEQDMSQSIYVTGQVASQHVMAVTTDLTTPVQTLNVSVGDHVNQGDVLCTFDVTDVNKQIEALEAQASNAQKQRALQNSIAYRNLDQAKKDRYNSIAAAESAVADAQNQYNQAAAASGAGSEEAQAAKSAWDAAVQARTAAYKDGDAAVQSAQDAIVQQQLDSSTPDTSASEDLAKLYHQRDGAVVRAGQSGLITQLNVSVGSVPNGTLMQIEDDKALAINVTITDKDIVRIQNGMKAEITASAFPDQTFGGTITRVVNFSTGTSPAPVQDSMGGGSSSGDSSSYSAMINVDEGAPLLLGMNTKVRIMIKDAGTSMAVPYDAIFQEGEDSYVFRAVPADDAAGKYKIEKVRVIPGENNDYYTAVTSDDLALGDIVISEPDSVTEGETTEVTVSDDSSIPYDASADAASAEGM